MEYISFPFSEIDEKMKEYSHYEGKTFFHKEINRDMIAQLLFPFPADDRVIKELTQTITTNDKAGKPDITDDILRLVRSYSGTEFTLMLYCQSLSTHQESNRELPAISKCLPLHLMAKPDGSLYIGFYLQ